MKIKQAIAYVKILLVYKKAVVMILKVSKDFILSNRPSIPIV